MTEFKILQGILALVDIVNFTGQSTKLGETYTAQYSEYFQDKIKSMVEKQGFTVVKSLGDAVLLFGTEPEGILDIMRDLFFQDKPEDKFGFISKFRMVAHSGYFQFKIEKNRPVDMVSLEGIKVFRMEKHARPWELVVTHALFQGIKPLVTQKQMKAHRMVLKEPLKGFDNEEWFPPFYQLQMVPEFTGVSNILKLRIKELERDVQTIPVFGNIYPRVPMEKNFINLYMEKWVHDRGEKNKRLYAEFVGKSTTAVGVIDVPTLYEKHCKGIIFGLPGAGKTTILRHLAFQEFKSNERAKGKRKRIVLFVPCQGIPFYDEWYIKRYGSDQPGEPDRDSALEYMTWVFLFGGRSNYVLTPEEWEAFQDALKTVKQAFGENRLTLLVDALDEAPGSDSKERIRVLFMKLVTQPGQGNRFFLTSRPSERIHFNQEEIPCFEMRSLTMDQVRAVARHLLAEDSAVYKKFDEAIWREEVVTKMATTPLTALLMTAYFQAYEKFPHRFPMYDLLVKFILLKAWETIKTGAFSFKSMEFFFKEIKKPNFLEDHRETRIFYEALASLCFDLFYDAADGKIQRSVNEETLMMYFKRFIDEHSYYSDDGNSAVQADRWIERFHSDHLLLQAGRSEYVFVHSTVMEYLAAYHLVQSIRKDKEQFLLLLRKCLDREDYLELETLPIAAGSDILRGFAILSALREIKVGYDRRLLYELSIKCLAELEWQITKTFQAILIENLKEPVLDIIRKNRNNAHWLYDYLKKLILTVDKELLKENIEHFNTFSKLSRPTLLEEYLDYADFNKGDPELVLLRRQLLSKLVQNELVEQWLTTHQKKEIDNVLQLDTAGYHPDDKNFNYYRRMVGKELAGFFGSPNLRHSGFVRACAFSPDGKTMVSASNDNTLKLWDVESGKEIRVFTGHRDTVYSCAFSPDGGRVVSGSEDKTLKLWDAASGKEIRAFTGHQDSVYSCAFSPDGGRVVSGSKDNTLKVWNATSGKEIREFTGHISYVKSCAFSPDGTTMLSASYDGTLKLWDATSGKEIRAFKGHTNSVNSCAFSPDGGRVVSASSDNTLKLWDAASGKEIRAFKGHTNSVLSCAFSPDGGCVVSASGDKTLKLWNAGNGKEIYNFTGHTDYILSCAFSPDGGRVVSGSSDNTLMLWDAASGKQIRAFTGHQGYVFSCAFSPDGGRVVSGSWDNTLKLWDTASGKEISAFTGHRSSVYSCTFSPDGGRVLSGSEDNTLKLWDAASGKEIRAFIGHQGYVLSCAFSPDGGRVVSASGDNTLKLWDAGSGKEIRAFTGHKNYVRCCVFSPDGGRLVSASQDNTLKLWDTGSGKEIRALAGHRGNVLCCAFSPDGGRVVSGYEDKTLTLWDTASGKEIRAFTGHQGYVLSCAFSPDGGRVLSGSEDKTLKLWDTATGKELKSLELPWIPYYVAFSPKHPGNVITANNNGTVTMFVFESV